MVMHRSLPLCSSHAKLSSPLCILAFCLSHTTCADPLSLLLITCTAPSPSAHSAHYSLRRSQPLCSSHAPLPYILLSHALLSSPLCSFAFCSSSVTCAAPLSLLLPHVLFILLITHYMRSPPALCSSHATLPYILLMTCTAFLSSLLLRNLLIT
jgi:hypothetical protein